MDGFTVHWIGIRYSNEMGIVRRMWAFLTFALLSGCRAVRIGGDVVFATSTPLTIAFPALFAKWRLRVPLVFEVRDLWPSVPIALGFLRSPILVWFTRWLEKTTYRRSSAIIALSPGIAHGVKSVNGETTPVYVIPNGCDVDLFGDTHGKLPLWLEDHPALSSPHLVVYAGALGYANNIEYLVDIAAEIRRLDGKVAFVILGNGSQAERVRRRAEENGVLGCSLWILPPVAKSEVRFLLNRATVATSFVVDNPAMWDNSANKFFDALASGRPIVINHSGWLAKLLEDSGAGLVLPNNDAEKAAKALVEFLTNENRIANASAAARRLAVETFDRDRLAGATLRVVLSVVN